MIFVNKVIDKNHKLKWSLLINMIFKKQEKIKAFSLGYILSNPAYAKLYTADVNTFALATHLRFTFTQLLKTVRLSSSSFFQEPIQHSIALAF